MKTVLIVTHRKGFEADPVIDVLRNRNVPVFRFNCDSGDNVSMVSYFLNSNKNDVYLKCDNFEINEKEIGFGWCQQLPPFLNQPSREMQCLQNGNIWLANFASLDLLEFAWLNKPNNLIRASNKIAQLMTAKKLGFNIPSTLVSNNPNRIRNFAKNNIVVAKNLATPWFVDSDQKTVAAYTKIVKQKWLDNDEGLSFSPVVYQDFYKRKKDYRIVIIGDNSFPASCIPNKCQFEDIRRGNSTGDGFIACDFDKDILKALRLLMKKFGIDYCAADFMEDEYGKLYFLEMNICGAWWWVDKLYSGAICDSLADFIEKRL